MAVLTPQGIQSTSEADYKSELETAFKTALGDDLDLDSQTPQGQIIGILSQNASDIDDNIVAQYNALNLNVASGDQLSAYGALFDISREAATPSVVTADLTGVPTTIIPAGSRAKTVDGDLFESVESIILDGTGIQSGTFRSVNTGSIRINAGTLTQIVDVVPGWETINNLLAGSIGQDAENDITYRLSYLTKLARNAVAIVESIRAAVASVTSVTAVQIGENRSDSTIVLQNIGLPSHSIAVIVQGGTAQEIGQAIFDHISEGCGTIGTNPSLQTPVVISTNNNLLTETIYFYPVELVPLKIEIDVTLTDPTAGNVINTIKDRILEYFNGTFAGGTDSDGTPQFDTSGIQIAETSYLSRLYTPVNSVPGFEVLTMTQEIIGGSGSQDVITPDLNQRLTISVDDIGVTIS